MEIAIRENTKKSTSETYLELLNKETTVYIGYVLVSLSGEIKRIKNPNPHQTEKKRKIDQAEDGHIILRPLSQTFQTATIFFSSNNDLEIKKTQPDQSMGSRMEGETHLNINKQFQLE